MLEINKFIGLKIKEARERSKDGKGMTQKELGDMLGYSPMAISHFENGIREIGSSDLKKIADCFHQDLSYFFPENKVPAMPAVTFFRADPTLDPAAAKSLENFEDFLKNRNG